MKKEWILHTETELKNLAETLIQECIDSHSTVVSLSGDVGAGKTTFTQILGNVLGVEESITSPTFTIMSAYDTQSEVFHKLVHIDAYRIEEESEIAPLHLTEVLKYKNALICIEWPENIASIIPPSAIKLRFEILPDESRRVTIV